MTSVKTMRAASFPRVGEKYRIDEVPIPPQLAAGEVLVRIVQSGICHSDCDAHKPSSPEALQPNCDQVVGGSETVKGLVGGHEGAGVIVAVADDVAQSGIRKVGDRVGLPFLSGYCGRCEACASGNENFCGSTQMRGFLVQGTWQQFSPARAQDTIPIPDEVPFDQACPILCAGVTVYKALKVANPLAGQFCVVPGAGGGLGHLCTQYARAMGLRVIAIDHGSKESFVRGLGAEHFVDFTKVQDVPAEVVRLSNGGAHMAIIAVGSGQAYMQALNYLRYLGKILAVGLAPFGLHSAQLLGKGISIHGSLVGTRQDCVEALDIVARGLVKCTVEIRELEDIERTLTELEAGKISGRVVINVSGKEG